MVYNYVAYDNAGTPAYIDIASLIGLSSTFLCPNLDQKLDPGLKLMECTNKHRNKLAPVHVV